MNTTVSGEKLSQPSADGKFKSLIRCLGPGIMMATAAVGGSHLVASTKAGAIYGWQLAGLILLVNLLKYPFFRAGVQYTMGTGKSLVQGYSEMGKGYLWLFTILSGLSSVVNTAALLLFSASLLGYFVPVDLPLTALCAIVLVICLAVLLKGHYKALDKLSKTIMAVLVITTITAVIFASTQVSQVPADFDAPSVWTIASI
ncbi:MAG: Nramp family divalent metal transporter, partial [Psychromonas sp.]